MIEWQYFSSRVNLSLEWKSKRKDTSDRKGCKMMSIWVIPSFSPFLPFCEKGGNKSLSRSPVKREKNYRVNKWSKEPDFRASEGRERTEEESLTTAIDSRFKWKVHLLSANWSLSKWYVFSFLSNLSSLFSINSTIYVPSPLVAVNQTLEFREEGERQLKQNKSKRRKRFRFNEGRKESE